MEQLPQLDVLADVRLEAGDAVGAEHEPDLEGAEAAPQGDLPVAVVGDEAGLGVVVAEVGGGDREGGGEVSAAFDKEAAVRMRLSIDKDHRRCVNRCIRAKLENNYLASKFVRSHLCMFISKLSKASKCSVK